MPRKISSGIATATGSLGTLSITDNVITTVVDNEDIEFVPDGTGDVVTSRPVDITGSASTTKNNGALAVTGGMAIGGSLYVGGSISAAGGLNTAVGSSTPAAGRFTTISTTGLATFGGLAEKTATKSAATGTVDHDYQEASVWYHTGISANFTVNLTNVPTTNNRTLTISLILVQGGTGYYVNAFQIDGVAQTIKWLGLANPQPTANAYEIQTFYLVRESSAWQVTSVLSSYGQNSLLGTQERFAASGTEQLRSNGITTNGAYWLRPPGQSQAYLCYCIFDKTGTSNNDWIAVSGMNSNGVRADLNGRASGLACLNINGENTSAAQLNTTDTNNNNGINFTLPREWINSLKPRGLRVRSTAEDMVARFDNTGTYTYTEDIWAMYYAINGYQNIPYGNGARFTYGTVNWWVGRNVRIYADGGATDSGSTTIVWTGNHHCGWSTGNSRHMLHGSTNFTYPGPYPGFCLDNTCWNQSGIVYLAATV